MGFDLDDTIINHTANRKILAEKYQLGEYTDSELYNLKQQGVEPAVVSALKKELYEDISLQAAPFPGVLDVMRQLMSDYNLFIISLRYSPEYGRQWIAKNLPFIKEENIFFTTSKEAKAPIAKNCNLKAFVDDNKKVLTYMSEQQNRVMFDYHRICNEEIDVPVVHDWYELRSYLQVVLK